MTVAAAHTKVGLEESALAHCLGVSFDIGLVILRMHVTRPDVTVQIGFTGGADKFQIGLIDEFDAVGTVDLNQHRRGIGQQTKARLTLAHRFAVFF